MATIKKDIVNAAVGLLAKHAKESGPFAGGDDYREAVAALCVVDSKLGPTLAGRGRAGRAALADLIRLCDAVEHRATDAENARDWNMDGIAGTAPHQISETLERGFGRVATDMATAKLTARISQAVL